MALTDEQWIAEARRQLLAAGTWRIPITPPALPPQQPAAAAAPGCPWCPGRPPLAVFTRREAVSPRPLYCCARCFGFWAPRDSLLAGAADAGDEHEALYASLGPARCRACGARLKPDGACRACGKVLPPAMCPDCNRDMDRETRNGITLDRCARCGGTWFDIGEVGRVYGLARPQSLACAMVDEHAGPDDSELALRAIGVLARMFVPFLPLP